MASFVNARNVIMISDNTGADNRHRYEKAASAECYPGHVLEEQTATIKLATDQEAGMAIADLNAYTAPTAGVAGDMDPFAVGDLVRYIYPLRGDIVRIKTGAVVFADDDKVDIENGLAIVAVGTLAPYGLVLEAAASADTHVTIRVL